MKKLVLFSISSLIIGFVIGSYCNNNPEPIKKVNFSLVDLREFKHLEIMRKNLDIIKGDFSIEFKAIDSTLYITENPLGLSINAMRELSDTAKAKIIQLRAN